MEILQIFKYNLTCQLNRNFVFFKTCVSTYAYICKLNNKFENDTVQKENAICYYTGHWKHVPLQVAQLIVKYIYIK